MHVISPLRLPKSRTTFMVLNLNKYRNTHYNQLNKLKVRYKEAMKDQILTLPEMNRIELAYVFYPKDRAHYDVANTCAVHDKFFCDALVEFGKLPDDNFRYIPRVSFHFGYVVPHNPMVMIHIKEI